LPSGSPVLKKKIESARAEPGVRTARAVATRDRAFQHIRVLLSPCEGGEPIGGRGVIADVKPAKIRWEVKK
jgi:hypothetical protein